MIEKLKKMKKKPLFFLLALLIVGGIGGTIALFTTTVDYSNVFSTSKYDVVIKEKFNDEFGTKEVNLTNDSSADVIIRVNYNESFVKKTGDENLILNNLVSGSSLVTKAWTEAFLNDFTYHDGWYYYNKKLKGNSAVQILTAISLNEELLSNDELKKEYSDADYELDFNLESIQASEAAIKKIWGYDISITGDEIAWNF